MGELGDFLRVWWSSKETCQQAKQLEKTDKSIRFLRRTLSGKSLSNDPAEMRDERDSTANTSKQLTVTVPPTIYSFDSGLCLIASTTRRVQVYYTIHRKIKLH